MYLVAAAMFGSYLLLDYNVAMLLKNFCFAPLEKERSRN